MGIRLIAIDVDGTLINSEGIITPFTKKILHDAIDEGIYVVIATGRSRHFLAAVQQQLAVNQPFICNNGAEVWLNNEQLLSQAFLPLEQAHLVQKIFEKHHVTKLWGNSVEGDFSEEDLLAPLYVQPMKLGAWFETRAMKQQVERQLSLIEGIAITSSAECNIEVMTAQTSKAYGLAQLVAHLGISLSEVICFGDSYNDLEMFKECGISVAMGNANEHIQQQATYVTASNDEDGIAKALLQFVF